MKDYFLSGRMLQPITSTLAPALFTASNNVTYNAGHVYDHNCCHFTLCRPFLSLSSAVWRLDAWNTTLVVLTSPVSSSQDVSFIVNMADYGYPNALSMAFSVHQILPDGSKQFNGAHRMQ